MICFIILILLHFLQNATDYPVRFFSDKVASGNMEIDSEKESWSEEELENEVEVELNIDFEEEVADEEECEGCYMSPWEKSSGSDRDSRSEDEGESIGSDTSSNSSSDEDKSISMDEDGSSENGDSDDDDSDDELSDYLELRRRVRCNEYGGMIALASFLAKPECTLEELDLDRADYLENDDAFKLASGLGRIKSLKTLSLAGNGHSKISVKGWGAIFSQLHKSSVEELILTNCSLDDAIANSLAYTLMNGTKLKSLRLSNNRTITTEGWKAIFSTLSHCNLRGLQDLSIGCQVRRQLFAFLCVCLHAHNNLIAHDDTASMVTVEFLMASQMKK